MHPDLTGEYAFRAGELREGVSVGFGTFNRHFAVDIGYGFPAYVVDTCDEGVLSVDVPEVVDNTLLWCGSSSRRLVDGVTPESVTKTAHNWSATYWRISRPTDGSILAWP